MSRLEELISEYCPNGVTFLRIEQCCTLEKGKTPIQKAIPGEYPLVVTTAERKTSNSFQFDKPSVCIPLVSSRGHGVASLNEVFYQEGKFALGNILCAVTPNNPEQLSAKFLAAYLNYAKDFLLVPQMKGGANVSLSREAIGRTRIPVPPLQVQQEIVRILDVFTDLTANLKAELAARKKQFEYCRNRLLTNDNDAETRPLSEIADISTGSSNTDDATENGEYPFFVRSQDPLRKNEYEYDEEAIITAGDGVGVGKVFHYIRGKYALHQRAYRIHPTYEKLDGRYLYHYFIARFPRYIGKQMFQGSVPSIRRPMLNKFEISIPAIEIQRKIVYALDNFETLCNDLNIGLPAEIEARKQQYEYYRDLLLTFAEDSSQFVNVERERERERARVERSAEIKLIQYVFGFCPVALGEIATIIRGGNFQKKDFTESGKPCIHYGQMYTHFGIHTEETLTFVSDDTFVKSKQAVPSDIVMAVTSENVEDVCSCVAWLGIEPIAVSGHTAIIHHTQNAKYLSYWFHTADFFAQKKKLAHGTKVIEVTPDKLNGIIINLPTLAEQERLVSILDRFDALCNDITAGLPAEIEARQKQYEYYRDKLLTFTEAV